MGDDTKAFLKKLLGEGFETYNSEDFGVLHTKKHTKIYWQGHLVKSLPSSPSDSYRGLKNARSQLRKGIRIAEERMEAAK